MSLFPAKLASAQNALKSLQEILQQPYTIIARDAAIQRFEYTVEAVVEMFADVPSRERRC